MLLACIGFSVLGLHTLKQAKLRQLDDRAQVLAFYSSPVVTIGDTESGAKILASLESDPTIESARILDENWNEVASFGLPLTSKDLAPGLISNGHRFVNLSHIEVIKPVVVGGNRLGTVYVRANTQDLMAQMQEFGRIRSRGSRRFWC